MQSKLESFMEAWANVLSGFVVSWLVWMFIAAPLFDIPVLIGESLALTGIFTVSSILRSYVWRRFFNASTHRKIHQWLT